MRAARGLGSTSAGSAKADVAWRKKPYDSVDGYIKLFPKEVQAVLQRLRKTVRAVEPTADESISYRIPTYKLEGKVLTYYAAFTNHVGLYPPAPKPFRKEVAKYAGPAWNLRFPLDEPIPYDVVRRITKYRAGLIREGKV